MLNWNSILMEFTCHSLIQDLFAGSRTNSFHWSSSFFAINEMNLMEQQSFHVLSLFALLL